MSEEAVLPDEPEPLSHVLRRWERRMERMRQAHALVLQEICRLLLADHVERMQVEYAGSQEQGAIHRVELLQGGQTISIPRLAELNLYQFCYALLPSGWDIGDGSHGELLVEVTDSRLTRRHWWHVQQEELDQEIITL